VPILLIDFAVKRYIPLDAVSAFYYSWHMNVAFYGLGLRLGPIRRRAPGLIEVPLSAG